MKMSPQGIANAHHHRVTILAFLTFCGRIARTIKRRKKAQVKKLLDRHPVVALIGPRQSGKTTLALDIAEDRPSVYLDLEAPSDLAKLSEPELYLSSHEDKLIILDEVQRVPDLFRTLRGLIDSGRRRGQQRAVFSCWGRLPLIC